MDGGSECHVGILSISAYGTRICGMDMNEWWRRIYVDRTRLLVYITDSHVYGLRFGIVLGYLLLSRLTSCEDGVKKVIPIY